MIENGELVVNKAYRASGSVPLVPMHLDDFSKASLAEVGKHPAIDVLADPGFVVLERRPTRRNGTAWYRVRLSDGRTGWFNSVALLTCNVREEVRPD